MGRDGAVCNGVGGSQHIYRDGYVSTGIQGESMPVAAGVAMHLKRVMRGSLAAAFIGDGTFGEGAVYEALNIAQLWRLPLLVIVENNHIAQSTPSALNTAGTIADRAAAFGMAYHNITSTDITEIRAELRPLVSWVRERPMPAVVEFDTVRVGPHSKGDDSRDEETLRDVRTRDWYQLYAAALGERFERADARQRALVGRISRDIQARPLAYREA
jgi:pyruvate dehydrogenase E1 component alpha subunit